MYFKASHENSWFHQSLIYTILRSWIFAIPVWWSESCLQHSSNSLENARNELLASSRYYFKKNLMEKYCLRPKIWWFKFCEFFWLKKTRIAGRVWPRSLRTIPRFIFYPFWDHFHDLPPFSHFPRFTFQIWKFSTIYKNAFHDLEDDFPRFRTPELSKFSACGGPKT